MRTLGLAIALLLVAATIGTAAARPHHQAPPKLPWVGIYSLEASGRQSTNWMLDHEPTAACDQQLKGSGNESDDFTGPGGGQVFVAGFGAQILSVVPEFASLTLRIAMQRDGTLTPGPEPEPSCGIASGDGGGTPPVPDCGARSGQMDVAVTPSGGTVVRIAPAPEPAFSTEPIDAEHEPAYPYNDCPNLGAILPEGLLGSDVRFPTTGVVDPGAPPIPGQLGPASMVGEGSDTAPLTQEPEITGSTEASYTLRLIRLATVAEVSASADQVSLGPGGSGTIHLRCPRQRSSCAGSAFIAADLAPQEEGAIDRFPAAAGSDLHSFGGRRFRLKGGHSGRVVLRIAHANHAVLESLRDLDLYAGVKLGSGRNAVRYLLTRVRID